MGERRLDLTSGGEAWLMVHLWYLHLLVAPFALVADAPSRCFLGQSLKSSPNVLVSQKRFTPTTSLLRRLGEDRYLRYRSKRSMIGSFRWTSSVHYMQSLHAIIIMASCVSYSGKPFAPAA